MRIEERGKRERGKIKCGEREGMIEGKREREVMEERKGRGKVSSKVDLYRYMNI